MTPPDEEATISVTTGSNHIAVIDSSECVWYVILVKVSAKSSLLNKEAGIHHMHTNPTAKNGKYHI